MAWTLEYDPDALRELNKLDRTVRERIIKFLQERLAPLDDPKVLGKRLQGKLSEFWSFRIGDYRVIARLEQQKLVIVVMRAAHRSQVYDW